MIFAQNDTKIAIQHLQNRKSHLFQGFQRIDLIHFWVSRARTRWAKKDWCRRHAFLRCQEPSALCSVSFLEMSRGRVQMTSNWLPPQGAVLWSRRRDTIGGNRLG